MNFSSPTKQGDSLTVYEITLCCKRWRLWPEDWPLGKKWSSWTRVTTRREANEIAQSLREQGAFHVSVRSA